MVALRNIKREGDRISCDYLPDGIDAGGRIEVNASTGDIVHVDRAQYESSNPTMYISLAQRRLKELIQSGRPLPESAAIATH